MNEACIGTNGISCERVQWKIIVSNAIELLDRAKMLFWLLYKLHYTCIDITWYQNSVRTMLFLPCYVKAKKHI